MRILLAKTFEPFSPTEADLVVLDWIKEIQAAGHFCECLRIPLIDGEPLARLIHTLELENTDRLVCLDEPCHHLRHPAKILVHWEGGSTGTPTFQGTICYEGVTPPHLQLDPENSPSLDHRRYRFNNRHGLMQFILV